MYIRRFLIIAAWVAGLCAIGAQTTVAQTTTLDLSSAIQRGLESNDMYRSALAERTRAAELIKQARSDVMPSLTFDASYAHAFEIPEVVIAGQAIKFGSKHSSVWGLTIEQSLWEGGRVFAAWAAARNVHRLAQASGDQAGIELQAQVATAFLDAWLARRLVGVAQEAVDVAEQNFEVVDKKFAQGLVSEYDHLRAKVSVANLRPSLIQAQNQRDIADSRLRTMIGLEPGTPIDLVLSLPDSSGWESQDLGALVDLALTQRPDLEAAKYEVRARENAVSAAKADYWPSLKLRATFDWQTYTEKFAYRRADISRSWQGMLTLSFPIFDGFRRAGTVGVAKVDLTQARLGRQELAKQVSLEVEAARNDFLEATERLKAQEQTVNEAQRGLDIANTRYESGVGIQLEIQAAQLDLTTARINAETAQHDRLVARVAWRRAMGEPVLNSIPLE